MKIQIGFERFVEGRRSIRLTPIQQSFRISPEAETLLGIVVMSLDAADSQPGDGEVDIPIRPEVAERIRAAIPFIGRSFPADGNLFLRLIHNG